MNLDPRAIQRALMTAKALASKISGNYLPQGAPRRSVDDVGKTVPEKPETMALQRQMLIDGKKAAVLYTSGSSIPPPEGMAAVHIPDGLLHYNPKIINHEHIAQAVRSNRLNDILGLGPHSKEDIAGRIAQGESPLAVVIRDQHGHEALSSHGTDGTADEQIAAMQHQVPEGGSIGREPVEGVLHERMAAMGHYADGGEVDDYLPPDHPDRQANLAKHMEGSVTPHVLYHGAYNHEAPAGSNPRALGDIDKFDRHAAIKTFNRPEGMDAVGSWFSETPGSHADARPGAGLYGTSIYPAHVRIKNPWVTDSFDHFLNEMHHAAGRDPHTQKPKGRGSVSELRNKLIAAGHDGIYFSEGLDHKNQSPTWVAFDPHQIKSAVGNNGHFDPQKADITKANGGEVDDDFRIKTDNPGGDWLKYQRENAEESGRKVTGAVTAYLNKYIQLDPEKVSRIPGSLKEAPVPGTPKYDALHKSMSEKGFDPEESGPILIGVNHRAEPYILEGNNRAAVARDHGIKSIPAEIRWYSGGEQQHDPDAFVRSLLPEHKAGGGEVDDYNTMIGNPDTDGPAGYAAGGEVGDQQQVIKPVRAKMARDGNKTPLDPNSPEAIKKAVSAAKMASTQAAIAASRAKPQPSGISETPNPKRLQFTADGPGGAKGINIPRHVWEGGVNAQGGHIPGMEIRNEARAKVYGPEHREPLTVGKVDAAHKAALAEHFRKPVPQQIADEKAAIGRLRAAQHLSDNATTLDESEKLDTVRHEHDDQGRSHIGYAAKGVAGHALYTSGAGKSAKFHIVNTCPMQTIGCGGGKDSKGVVDTSHGTCFAPHAEAQYSGASIKRACHEQAKHDPAMTKDWIVAHTGSLRAVSAKADKNNQVTLFRPNVVDETDRSSRDAIHGLNKQREAKGLPKIIANSYGKTNELHDPENGYFVTHSNVGPKVKRDGDNVTSVQQNIQRDKQRIRSTILAQNAGGTHFTNEDGRLTPPKNSYAVTDVARGSTMDKAMQGAFTHAKYWSAGRNPSELSAAERTEGPEGHFGASGEATRPEDAHYGHTTVNGNRYDYQKQHILHPRLVAVKDQSKGTTHLIPTDSRFKDDDFLPRDRFMSKNGKKAGAILLTTPTTSTSEIEHKSAFTHHVGPEDIKHAESHNGEYQIDAPQAQEAAKGMEYQPPRAPGVTQRFAQGGAVEHIPDDGREFPEQSFMAQGHNAHAGGMGDPEARHRPLGGGAHGHHLATGGSVDKALSVSARAVKSSRKTFSR